MARFVLAGEAIEPVDEPDRDPVAADWPAVRVAAEEEVGTVTVCRRTRVEDVVNGSGEKTLYGSQSLCTSQVLERVDDISRSPDIFRRWFVKIKIPALLRSIGEDSHILITPIQFTAHDPPLTDNPATRLIAI